MPAIRRWLDGLAARRLWRRMDPDKGQVVLVMVTFPRERWAVSVAPAPEGVDVWYGQAPIVIDEWTTKELETWIAAHDG